MSVVNPRSITEAERSVLDGLTVEDQADLIGRVRELGYPDPVALGIVGWLAAKAGHLEDRTSSSTRATYRRILREVAEAAAKVGADPGYLKGAGRLADEAA